MGVLCFIHMPRTGGRSIRKAIDATWRRGEVLVSGKTYPTDFEALARQITPETRVVYGHMNFGLGRHADVDYATVLRDPMSRMLSWYRYWRAWEIAEKRTLIPFAEFMAITQSQNLQAKILAGVFGQEAIPADGELLEAAAANLRQIEHLGVFERIDAFCRALAPTAELPHVKDPGPDIAFTPTEAAIVAQANAVDLALYRKAREQLGVAAQ
jgi:hypothetical protein